MSSLMGVMEMCVNSNPTWWNKPLWGYKPETQPWWNRPLWGRANVIEIVLKELNKEVISEDIVYEHNNILEQLYNLQIKIDLLNFSTFENREFLLYLEIQKKLNNRFSEYAALSKVLNLLIVGIEVRNLFISLEQLESRYRTAKQQNFYQFVTFLLEKNLTRNQFLNAVNNKAEEISSAMITVCSQTALKSYIKVLESLSDYEFGFKLLYLFKKYKVTNYSILNSLFEIVHNLLDKELEDCKYLLTVVTVNSRLFSKLTEITGLPDELATLNNYAKILQFITLSSKYDDMNAQFNDLKEVLQTWHKYYQSLLAIREQYDDKTYKQCSDFKREIPGENIFNQYKSYL